MQEKFNVLYRFVAYVVAAAGAAAVAGPLGLAGLLFSERSSAMDYNVKQGSRSEKTAIRPFHMNVPEAELAELRRRINANKVA